MTKKVHYISGIFLIVFITGHLLNHLMILVSPELHISFMEIFRKFYRLPPVEILLYMAVLIQVFSGTKLLRKKWNNVQSIWDRLQIYSGMFFIYFLIIHPMAVLYGRYIWHLDTNLYFGASVLNVNPLVYYFTFHYGLATIAFFTHMACIHRVKMQSYTSIHLAANQARLLIVLGLIISFLIVYNMMGIDIPKEYLEKY